MRVVCIVYPVSTNQFDSLLSFSEVGRSSRPQGEEKSVHGGSYVAFTPGRVFNKSERTCKSSHFVEVHVSVYGKDMERYCVEEI